MTAAEIADKLREAGGDTASLSPVEQELLMRAEAAPAEPKIVKRIEAATLQEGLAQHGGNYWTEIVGAYTSWVIRPDGSLAGVVTQVRKGD